MKDRQLEVQIISARPKDKGATSPFARRVIQHIKTDATFSQVLRTTSSKVNRRTRLMRQLTIPRKAIVVFVAVLLVSGMAVGAYALQQSKKAGDTLDKVGQNQNIQQKAKPKPAVNPPVPEQKAQQQYLEIKEWGIKVPIDGSVGNLTYTLNEKSASIRSTELDKLSGGCRSNSINVARGKATEIVPNAINTDQGSTFLETYNSTTVDASKLTARSIKAKAGEYYFVVPGYAGASCGSLGYSEPGGKEQSEAETQAQQNIIKAVNQLVQL